MLNVNNADYLDYVLGYSPKMAEEMLLLLFSLRTKIILVAT